MPTTAELVDNVLGEAHERLQARCDRNKIVEILEDEEGVYDGRALCNLLNRRYEQVGLRVVF